jgi:hypothetical protein
MTILPLLKQPLCLLTIVLLEIVLVVYLANQQKTSDRQKNET